jgi:hypothetical protein
MQDKKLTAERIADHHFKIIFDNKKHIGYAVMDVDGYYYFDPITQSNGFWNSYSLRMISDLLDEINSEHDNKIREYFKKEIIGN